MKIAPPAFCALLLYAAAAVPARADLVAYWPFNDAATLGKDTAGGTLLTASGGASFTATGKSGGGLLLNGASQFLSGTVTGLPAGNSPYTQAAWIKPAALGARGIVGWGNFGTTRQVNALRLYDSGNGFRHYWWGADLDAVNLPTSLANGSWHHVATTWDGTTRRIYLNGTQVAQDTPGANNATAANFRIGSTNNAEFFSGSLDEVVIYSHALTTAEIQSLASGASPQKGPVITAFTADSAQAFEGGPVQLNWTVNTDAISGTFSYEIKHGTTTLTTGSTATGTFAATMPDLGGRKQAVTFTLRAIETGGGNTSSTATVSLAGDPGIPAAHGQSGLSTGPGAPLNITLSGADPNGGTLTFAIVTPPAKGQLTGSGAARSYTPSAGAEGTDAFSFKVSDGKYESEPAWVLLRIAGAAAAPELITVDDLTIAPENVAGDFLSNIAVTDANAGEAHTFTLVSGAGSRDNANFTISGHQLRAASSFAALNGQSQSIRIRATDAGGLWVESSFTLSVVPKTRGVVVNEIHYNSADNTALNSFVELYNDGAETANLDGWRLSGGVDYRFPAGTTIPAGGYLLIAENPAVMQSYFGKTALGPWDNAVTIYPDGSKETNGLSNDGDQVRLRDATDAIVSEADYGVRSPWPADGNGEGSSIELIHPSLDASHGSNWRAAKNAGTPATPGKDMASPGAQNLSYAATAAPAVRTVAHQPQAPASKDPVIVTARITDPQGVASVSLAYQLCTPGNFIPSTLPKAISGGNFVNVAAPLAPNPAFELPSNWTTIPMNDDGLGDDVQGGDGTWTATIPPQAHRTLVRYRITAADNAGTSARVPYADDPSLNFACFVYNGVPDYQGTSSADLQTLPVYHFLTRKEDYEQCVAHDPANRLVAGLSWTFENWEACFVADGIVYDHIPYRLKGANGRYIASGTGGAGTAKRAFKFLFHKGYEFDARDEKGNPFPEKWSTMITENCWENRATYTFSLNEMVNFHILNQLGIPSPLGTWAHFRTIKQAEEQPDAWHGDFWGLMYVHEDYDRRFLKAHNLKKGNLYKLTRDGVRGLDQFRYQAAFAPKDGSDHDTLQNTLRGTSTPAFITGRVNLDLWARYHAFSEAIRHYDYWPSGDNNAAMYFYPKYEGTAGKGVLWYLPNDLDATWGPTWNNGHDLIHNSLFNDAASTGGDPATNPTLWPVYFNQLREIRRLLWQPDQINPLIDQFAAVIRPFVNADYARWLNAPADAGSFDGLNTYGTTGQAALDNYVSLMKDFAFDPNNNGSTWPGGNVGMGGRAKFLDQLGNNLGENTTKYPAMPVITYTGPEGFPPGNLRFSTTEFSDPQGANTFAAVQWRMAEVNTSATYDPLEPRLLEITASHDSGEITTFAAEYVYPPTACQPGKRYRARVRMKDATGRWSPWSDAVEFTAGAFDPSAYASAIVITEIMYHATNPTAAEQAVAAGQTPPAVWTDDDFDYVELRNVSANPVDLSGFQFTAGFDYIFPGGTVLNAGASLVLAQNPAAFAARYGEVPQLLEGWDPNDKLSNGGELLTLQYGQVTTPVFSFAYDDEAGSGWPSAPDGRGASLVRIAPEDPLRDPALAINWRSSLVTNGTPGGDDRTSFTAWLTTSTQTGALSDTDGDGLPNLVEYALGTSPAANSAGALPVAELQLLMVDGETAYYPVLRFSRSLAGDVIIQRVEFSTDLLTWDIPAIQVSSTNFIEGQREEMWRAPFTAAEAPRFYGRVRFTLPGQ